MHVKRLIFTLVLMSAFTLQGLAYGADSELRKAFIEAYDSNNALKVTEVVKAHQAQVPDEIKKLIEESTDAGIKEDARAEKIYIAELLAREYKNITDDAAPLIEVKKVDFHTMLHPEVHPEAKDGVYTVTIPSEDAKEKNVFKPDNIVIGAGETVRWVNHDKVAHVFASMPLIGEGGIFAPSIKPHGTWEFKFEKPGEYYYLCFIHKGMVGKVTVAATAGQTGNDENGAAQQDKKPEKGPSRGAE
ncbi:MAG: hypothetical protein BMS9Abin23_0063 [Thermodesulfobacteriota bacterium]|nr:MAG: hypothetical protein BMS9Abin23_0063 [Thermodesulfobacteriota bacterium]